MDRLVIKKHPMAFLPMFAKCFSVVSCNRDHSVLIQPVLPQYFHKAPDDRVRVSNLAVIKSGSVARLERFRRIVRVVRVVKVKPDKKRAALLMLVNPP